MPIREIINHLKTFCATSQSSLFEQALKFSFDKFLKTDFQEIVDYIYMECNASTILLNILFDYSNKRGLNFDQSNFFF